MENLTFTQDVTAKDIRNFCKVTGINSPIHGDKEIMAKTRFGKPISCGLLTLTVMANLIVKYFKMPIVVSQEADFVKPVFAGDTLTAICDKVEEMERERKLLCFHIENQNKETVVIGNFIIKTI